MPSFDFVSKIDMGELDNAVNNIVREVSTRYDFRNSQTTVSLDKKEGKIHLVTSDDMKMKALDDMIRVNCVRRKVSPDFLEFGKTEPTSKGSLKKDVKIKEGISQDVAREIVKIIKDMKFKVQAAIQDDHVRVTAKKIDDLQEVIQLVHSKDLKVPLQEVNMK